MRKTIVEDWEFEITVKNRIAKQCRTGFKTGDKFSCKYECPSGFCPKTIPVLYTLCEIARCGGDYKLRSSDSRLEIDFPCADGPIVFHLTAKHIDA